MRTITYGAACSLDLFIARSDHSVDWLMWGKEAGAVTAQYWMTIDTVLMGRKTFERSGGGAYPNVKNYVFSRKLKNLATPNATLVEDDAVKFVRALKRKKGKGICVMGGGEFANALFEAGLIDEVGMNMHPILLGAGIPLFHGLQSSLQLERLECTPFANGCVYLLYRVA